MQNNTTKKVSIEYTHEFKRNLRTLAKKYYHIRSDIKDVIDALQKGELLGDKVPRVGYTIFKVRVQNSDIKKGKRSGYRFIYYLQSPIKIILITIYSKLDQGDISPDQIRPILKELNENKK